MQASIADMWQRGGAGSIGSIWPMNAHCGMPELATYAGKKGAMATLTRNAHMADQIRVNDINPGWVAIDAEQRMQAETLVHGPDRQGRVASHLPPGRLITTEECARLAVFLHEDASVPIGGALIDIGQKVAGAL